MNKNHTTLLIGENGVGKSQLLDAISFGLYGRPFRKINKDQLVNSINNKHLVVEVEFSIGKRKYFIRRGIKPSFFEIFIDDKLIDQTASIKDYQEQLEKNILKMKHKSFSQVVVLGTSTYVPFMQLPAAHRRAVIEDLLDIEVFSVMNSLLKERIQTVKSERCEIEKSLSSNKIAVKLTNKHIKEIEDINDDLITSLKQKIKAAEEKIQEYRETISFHSSAISEISKNLAIKEKVSSKSKEFTKIKTKLDTKINRHKKENTFYVVNNDCPSCGQPIDLNFKEQVIEKNNEEIKKTSVALNKVEERLNLLQQKMIDMKKIQQDISDLNNIIISTTSSIEKEEGFIVNTKNEIEKNKTQKDDIEKKKDELALLFKTQNSYKNDLKNNSEDLDVMMSASFLLKDGGIKTRIIKQYIPVINQLINKYLAMMNFYCLFNLDENFVETIKSRHRDNFSYHSFSEGEKIKINMAILFCWRGIAKLRNSVSTNLLIMDEVLDASLDQQGTEDFLKIIKNMSKDVNIFIISHKTENILDKFDEIIKIVKVKNFTRKES